MQDLLIGQRKWEEWAAHLTEDFVSYDNRSLVHEVFNAQQAIETIRFLVGKELGRNLRPQFASLATRGEYLHLGRLSITDHDDDDGLDMGMLIVDEWTADGKRKRSASFDPDALNTATATLDQWYREFDAS